MTKKYNFDEIISREGSGDYKNGALLRLFGRTDLIPMWVADMDWATPPFIVDALKKRMEHPIFGYTLTPRNMWTVVRKWIREHHQWDVPEEWMTYIPGIVKGIGMAINVFLKEDEKVIIQPPVYHPFRLTPEGNRREVVFNPLKELPNGSYAMDFDNLEQVCDEKCKMLILSNPHNPAGIVWDIETLQTLAHFCASRGILVISDEIHCDMVLTGHKHLPFAAVSEEAAQCSITFGAPSKTFNIAGIVSSYAIVPNDELRKKFYEWLEANELNEPTIFSPIATIAAFGQGEEWRQEMLQYVEENIKLVVDYCAQHLPKIKPLVPDASFLVWLDCRDMGLDHDALIDFFVNKARLALNDGEMFGPGGEGHMRMNVAAPRCVILKALEQLKEVY
ncbi:putative C-S lyase [Pseudoprevotella muciniphila]|uniref:cysteine-S-conjugate beta-lyase n=1 Tax=Pseudoprevotella muciniphila TaxID=2133944 RepID=A0A5P8E9V3_9BACT|nr:PatB family C-S lyase [Pseudoprevotella muciniphila]QFQ13752.1 putative C-S lyase [Pseudoprevotella muciniphila]